MRHGESSFRLSQNNKYNDLDKEEYSKKLYFINNLCQYMICLVKDFEVISNFENNIKQQLAISNVAVSPLLQDLKDIIQALIQKKTQGIS